MWKWLLCLALATVPRLTQAHDMCLEKQGGAQP
jgi:hypothetical protein